MGQSASLPSPGESVGSVGRRGSGNNPDDFVDSLDFLHEQIRKHSLTLRQLTLLTNEEFNRKIDELNELSSKFVDCNSKQLLFAVKPGTDRTVLWKGTVRIKCVKLDSLTKKVEKSRELSLKQFLQVYNTLQLHLSATATGTIDEEESNEEIENVDKEICENVNNDKLIGDPDLEGDGGACCSGVKKIISRPPKLTSMSASVFLDKMGKSVTTEEDEDGNFRVDDDSCCICMDSKPQVSLPCAHSYCLACIEQWNVDHKTCPICRETLETTDDTWVLEDVPNSDDVSQEIQKSLFALTK